MNKADLVAQIAEESNLTRAQAEKALTAFTDAVRKALAEGDKVTLVGFGVFSVGVREARVGRNPQTKEPMEIPASRSVWFKAGQGLREAVKA
jgi:DNA-binding protein HU-beta